MPPQQPPALYIHYNVNDVKEIAWALTLLTDNVRMQAFHEGPRLLALNMRNYLMKDISTNRYKFKQYNTRYAAWKQDYGGRGGFWQLAGDLMQNIVAESLGYGHLSFLGSRNRAWLGGSQQKPWFVGIKQGVMDRGGKSWYYWKKDGVNKGKPKPIAMYAWVLEYGGDFTSYGGGNHPGRPLFHRSFANFAKGPAVTLTRGVLVRAVRPWGRKTTAYAFMKGKP